MRRPLGVLAAAAALATIAAPVSAAQAVTASPASYAPEVGTARENTVVRLVNARRAKKGCRALKHHPRLHRAARGHSADMAENRYFSHTSRDGRSFTDRIEEAGFIGGTRTAENIGRGQRTPAMAVQSWMNTPGTRAAMLNCRFTFIGVGAAEDYDGAIYWTQLFATK
ncbi:CAP domain-containing protein [Nonomuraea bangladeshensis]|uniref:CAP domain-containing protein n=1 Tax=Nonomuraea bangladeshensis TaxID=404385 RepID=UPI003C2D1917